MTKTAGNEDCRTFAVELGRKGKAEHVFEPSDNLLPQGVRLVNCKIKVLRMYICYF